MITYLFINQEHEILLRIGFHTTNDAADYAQKLANYHECDIDFCELISVVPPISAPAEGDGK